MCKINLRKIRKTKTVIKPHTKKSHVLRFHACEISRIGISVDTKQCGHQGLRE